MDVVPHTQIAKMAHDVKQLQNMMDAFDELYTTIFVAGTDFGPGRRGGKNVLLKPGAEKIFGLFNLTARTSMTEQECDHKQGFFSYRVVCEAFDRPSGAMVAEAMGACNSREQRLASDGDPFALHNVCLKMAENRAFVNCAMRLGMASDRFTQDMVDLAPTAQPSTILAITDHMEHPAIAKQERPRIREFINREPEPDRAKEFLDRMKDRIEEYETKRKSQAAPSPATERPINSSYNSPGHNDYNDSNDTIEQAGSTAPPQARNEPSTPLHRGSPGRIQMAMAYLRSGLSIIPLNGKAPVIPDWTKFAHQLPTTDHVSVWRHEHPTANLGIVCGPASGVFVLDQDGEQGLQSLLLRELPPTPKVKTASGRGTTILRCRRTPSSRML